MKILKWTVQGLAILALTLMLTEIAFRTVDHFKPIYIFPSDSYNRFRAAPNTLVRGAMTNSFGFRDEEIAIPKPAGRQRVLVLGDSFVFGIVPYEHLFTTVLERRLAESGDIDVVNMGIPRTSVDDYYAVLTREGLRADPDVVVICFYIGNDFIVWEDPDNRPRSYVLALFRYLFHVLPSIEGQEYGQAVYEDAGASMSEDGYLDLLARRLPLFDRRAPAFEPSFGWVTAYLERALVLCRKWEVEPLVVLIPDEIQVDAEVRAEALRALDAGAESAYDFDLPSDRLRSFLQQRDVAVLDLLPGLRDASADGRVYKPRDTHWNVRGNRVAAEEIYQEVYQLLPGSVKLPPSAP